MSGWFAMKRGIHDHPLFYRKPERLFVWSWILSNASWAPRRFDVGGTIIEVERGQLCVTQKQIEDATGVSRKIIRDTLAALEAENAVVTKRANGRAKGKTLITICNWDKYQVPERVEGQAEGQRRAKQGPLNIQGYNSAKAGDEEIAADPVKDLFDLGRQILMSAGHSKKQAGTIIGKWRSQYGDEQVMAALLRCQSASASDPVGFCQGIFRKRKAEPKPGDTRETPDGRVQVYLNGIDGWMTEHA